MSSCAPYQKSPPASPRTGAEVSHVDVAAAALEPRDEYVVAKADKQASEPTQPQPAEPSVSYFGQWVNYASPFIFRFRQSFLQSRGIEAKDISTPVGTLRVYDGVNPEAERPITAVLIPGFGARALDYFDVMRSLRHKVQRVICIDPPGHGDSDPLPQRLDIHEMVDAIYHALDQLGLNGQVVLHGNSMGGHFALRLAMKDSLRDEGSRLVHRLVLSSPAGAPMNADQIDDIKRLFAVRTAEDAERFIERLFSNPPNFITRAILTASLQHRFTRSDHLRIVEEIKAEFMFTQEQVRSIRVPMKIYWGTQDKILPNAEFWQACQNDTIEFISVPNAGHSQFLEDHEEAANQIADA